MGKGREGRMEKMGGEGGRGKEGKKGRKGWPPFCNPKYATVSTPLFSTWRRPWSQVDDLAMTCSHERDGTEL